MVELIGYKIVKYRMFSVIQKEYGKIRYKKKVWNHRKEECGPLAVFTNKQDAEHFILINHIVIYHIYMCKYEQSKENCLYDLEYTQYLKDLPKGTDFADKVMLLEKLK